jgi:integrase
MTDRLARELDGWSQRTIYRSDDDLVFAHPQTGNPMDRSKVTKRFKQACRDGGVRVIRFHDLRHTFASLLIAEGANVVFVSRQLGHANPAITLSVYAHEFARAEHATRLVTALERSYSHVLHPDNSTGGSDHAAHLKAA